MPYVVSDGCCQVPEATTGFQFREDMFAYLGEPPPSGPSHNVLLFMRQWNERRRVLNLDAMVAVITDLGLNYTCVTGEVSFRCVGDVVHVCTLVC